MTRRRVILKVLAGPNEGDTVSVDQGSCRLIGRHLSESETTLMDRDGNRLLDGSAMQILTKHLKTPGEGDDKAEEAAPEPEPVPEPPRAPELSSTTFERGPDIIFADDSISRAHAMVFYDDVNVGIIDLASTNGTYVNAERISSSIMQNGDTVSIGNSDLTVELQ